MDRLHVTSWYKFLVGIGQVFPQLLYLDGFVEASDPLLFLLQLEQVVLQLFAHLRTRGREREFFIDNLLVRIHLIIEMVLVDRPCAMGV